MLGTAFFIGTLGVSLILGWSLLRFAGAHDPPPYADQPAPAWLPRVGVTLTLLGAVLFVGTSVASRYRPGGPREAWSERAALVLFSAAFGIGMVVSAVGGVHSDYRWRPLAFAGVVLVVPWWIRQHTDE